MRVLDLTAGNRAVWFDRRDARATFIDIRPEVEPDIVADSGALPASVGCGFDLVVFDPPHKNNGKRFGMARSYGSFTAADIEALVRRGAREAHRLTRPEALMAFKWNDHSRKLVDVLQWLAPAWSPLFGHGVTHQQRSSATSWVMLVRGEAS